MMPYLVGGLAGLLILVGIVILVVFFTSSGRPSISLFASATPTATSTFTPTATVPSPTPTSTNTPTLTPTITLTPTVSGPFEYTVQENDSCWSLAYDKFKVDINVLLALNPSIGVACNIKPGDKIQIPAPDQTLPTETPIASDMRGTVTYIVKAGETVALIATRFNSTTDAILAANDKPERGDNRLSDVNDLQAGQELIIPVNIVTVTPTRVPSITPTPGGTTAPTATATTEATTAVSSATPTP